jgi:adenylate cyclase
MAYAELAWTHYVSAQFGWGKDPRESARRAYEAANKAVSLDDSLDTPHCMLGLIYCQRHEFDKAIAEVEKGVELNPNGHGALLALGVILNRTGRPAEAIVVIEKAIRLNPLPPALYYAWLGTSHMLMNQNDKAIASLKKGLGVQSDNAFCLINLTAAYSLSARQEDARKTAEEFLRLNPKFSSEAFAKVYQDPAVRERLIDALRKAGLN